MNSTGIDCTFVGRWKIGAQRRFTRLGYVLDPNVSMSMTGIFVAFLGSIHMLKIVCAVDAIKKSELDAWGSISNT